MSDFAFLIKTILRPKCLEKCLRSLREQFPEAPVWIADDSPKPYPEVAFEADEMVNVVDTTQFEPAVGRVGRSGILYATFPYDIGIGTCYNWMIDRIQKPYICLLDDDFVFTDRTRVERFVPWLSSGAFDLVGGEVWGKARGAYQGFAGYFTDPGQAHLNNHTVSLRKVDRERASGPIRVQVTMNFWMARTEALRDVRWDPALKVCRHEDFFLRFIGYEPRGKYSERYHAAFWRGVEIVHDAPPMGPEYRALRRDRFPDFREVFKDKWGFEFV